MQTKLTELCIFRLSLVTSSTPGARKEDAGMGRGWIVVGEREREAEDGV